jgi:HAD superfamily hydrolase (TIGR01549 family)
MKAVLFDCWGTLVENGIFPSPVKQVKFILRLKMPFSEFIVKFEEAFMTKRFRNLTEAFNNVIKEFDVNPPDWVRDKLVGMWNKNTLLSKPFPETLDTLKALREKGIKVGLISNTDQFSVDQVMDKFELRGLFDAMALSYEEGKLKTDPAFYEKLMKRLGVRKEDCIVVGDSIESDMKGADAAGIRAYLIDRKDRREYENKILSLTEVIALDSKGGAAGGPKDDKDKEA